MIYNILIVFMTCIFNLTSIPVYGLITFIAMLVECYLTIEAGSMVRLYY